MQERVSFAELHPMSEGQISRPFPDQPHGPVFLDLLQDIPAHSLDSDILPPASLDRIDSQSPSDQSIRTVSDDCPFLDFLRVIKDNLSLEVGRLVLFDPVSVTRIEVPDQMQNQ